MVPRTILRQNQSFYKVNMVHALKNATNRLALQNYSLNL